MKRGVLVRIEKLSDTAEPGRFALGSFLFPKQFFELGLAFLDLEF